MTHGTDMVKFQNRLFIFSGHPAIFTAIARAFPDQRFEVTIHVRLMGFVSAVGVAALRRAPRPRLEDAEQTTDPAVCLDLRPLFASEPSFPRFRRKLAHSLLVGRSEAQGEDPLDCLSRERGIVRPDQPP